MLTTHGTDVHLQFDQLLLILPATAVTPGGISVDADGGRVTLLLSMSRADFTTAVRRGKAYKRTVAQRTREARMAEAAADKRARAARWQ